ncbi:hypothetical protein QCN29_06230 [Streptomyces sp. HNM0663]|uniref:Uncharacterized protein n=1 Tax=Streptomyces chengmaiensis TaxID=3040919 RepID=A0ABT6HI76_9ACTN|nr:hypothetical protein [Streptomyces chengmaiensis]MDH2388388.1 hypothetical protein [Streptomyces chengmaiensis]
MATASIDTTELETVVGWLLVGQARKSRGVDIYNALRVKNGKAAVADVSAVEIHDHNTASADITAVTADINAAS